VALDKTVFEPDAAWKRALEKYGAATHLTVELYGRDARWPIAQVHSTPLFELLAPGHHALSMFAACVQRCLTQTAAASTIVVEQRHSLAVIGSPLMLNGEVVGAAVAAYVLTAFPDEHAVRRLAKECNVTFAALSRRIREELPLTRARLCVYGELLQVLCNTGAIAWRWSARPWAATRAKKSLVSFEKPNSRPTSSVWLRSFASAKSAFAYGAAARRCFTGEARRRPDSAPAAGG